MKRRSLFLAISLYCLAQTNAQLLPNPKLPEELTGKHWEASWVKVPEASAYDYGVYFFRNTIELTELPDKYIIHVSADNRYKLVINGEWVGLGPARGDANNWVFETYDIADYLKIGENIIAVVVWNFGENKPWAQISLYSGLIIQGENALSSELNTPGSWKCKNITAYEPIPVDSKELGTFIIVGPGDQVDGNEYPWRWEASGYDDSGWQVPELIDPGSPKGVGTDISHALVPRTIPAMELKRISSPLIRKIDDKLIDKNDEKSIDDFQINAHTKTSILLDQGELVNAYPELILSGGHNARVKLTYAETLFMQNGRKPHRDSINNMLFKGNSDLFISDGENLRSYTTLWFRTFRYILLEVETDDEPLTIKSVDPVFTAYPFQEKAYFESDETGIKEIWDVAWRTSRLCANELYYDCPYYEQMQYVGDTRIQSLISVYMSGDDRLMRKAINDYYNSMIPEGLTQSRYPTEPRQVIPTFSLFWVSMIHDYMWYNQDYLFTAKYLVNIQHVLQWFESRIDSNTGMIGPVEYWPFVDWTDEWPWDNVKHIGGVPPGAQEGNSSIITLHYAMTLEQAADIFSFYGLNELSEAYSNKAEELKQATKKLCWDKERNLFADTPEKTSYSQHANIFAVLAKAIPEADLALFIENVIRDKTLIQASIYFRFYLQQAMMDAGLGNKYLSMLGPWKKMIDNGLTTFAEIPDLEGTRSDCHAWSSSPIYELLASVAGIRPAAVGFKSVIIEPHPGKLTWIKAGVPHYLGEISLDLKFSKDGSVKGNLTIPPGLSGIFVWDSQTIDLKPGKQKIAMKSMDSRFNLK